MTTWRDWSRWCASRAGSCRRWREPSGPSPTSGPSRKCRPPRSVAMTGEPAGLWAGVAPLVASHLALVLVAMAVAVAIGLPLAVALARRPRLAASVVTVAGAIQTVPGLALLALMVPVIAAT